MRIATFRVENYKGFCDSGEITFEPGFNVIVGQNNVGKTALAEALGLRTTATRLIWRTGSGASRTTRND